jgi:hypothetical protein
VLYSNNKETHDEYFRVWIDYNKNGTFETSEQVYESQVPRPDNGTNKIVLWAEMQIPKDIPLGDTRMRIAMCRNQYPIDACTAFNYGEVEDYTLKITDNIIVRAGEEGGKATLANDKEGIQPDNLSEILRIANPTQQLETIKALEQPTIKVVINITPDDDKNITIFPNPTNDVLNINLAAYIDQPATIQISNMIGKRLYQENLAVIDEATLSIPLGHYPSGTYFVAISIAGKNTEVRKFVIQ